VHVAIAHEWLVRYAGSERCVEQMLVEFPEADLLTTLLDEDAVPPAFGRARPSFLQSIPGATSHHEWLLPLMPLAWRLRGRLDDADVVISSSHACAKAVRVPEHVPHLCYCYTPMRYAWDFDAERERFPVPLRAPARVSMSAFRRWDRRKARRVTRFLGISRAVAKRVERFYGREAGVVFPPVRTEYFTPGGERGDAFLFVGRLVAYKRADLVIDAFADLPYRLLVVGEGQHEERLRARATPNVEFLGAVGDERLRELYRTARALVYPADEDFGIVMVEAHACGAPVVAFAGGGALDIIQPDVTGWLIARQSVKDVREAVEHAARTRVDEDAIRRRAEEFSEARFRRELRDEVEHLAAGR
jgi:glycosyltransferase involved in cell wall biosynthesis